VVFDHASYGWSSTTLPTGGLRPRFLRVVFDHVRQELSEGCNPKPWRRVTNILMNYYVYLVRLGNGDIYTGSTPNLRRRIKEHVEGKCPTTKALRPIKLIWYCAFNSRLNARQFENYLIVRVVKEI